MRLKPATIAAGIAALLLVAGFVALGLWQVERRAWKHALIARVAARAHAAPTAPPGPDAWSRVTETRDAYRRVVVAGIFDNRAETTVRAATALGSGYWVMTPLVAPDFTVLVNRGFVPPDQRGRHARPAGRVAITGYLRITEPRGGFLRTNDPASDRWYSRDVAAIAAARRLGPVAPYFIDADRAGDTAPVGGLTVIAFPDNHLVYALTWFALAALTLIAFGFVVRHDAGGEG